MEKLSRVDKQQPKPRHTLSIVVFGDALEASVNALASELDLIIASTTSCADQFDIKLLQVDAESFVSGESSIEVQISVLLIPVGFGSSMSEIEMAAIEAIHQQFRAPYCQLALIVSENFDLNALSPEHNRILSSADAFLEYPFRALSVTICLQNIANQFAQTSRSRQLEYVSRARIDFLANMSHEIRTPLNGIIGMAELMRDKKLSAAQAYYLRNIINSGQSLMTVINDILDISKIDSGKMEIEEVAFNLDTLLEEVSVMFHLQNRDSGVEYLLDCAVDVPTDIAGDPTRIKQVLVNLISNAFKFTESGHVRVSISLQEKDSLFFSVNDTGKGIAADRVESVFTSFEQEDSSTTRRFGGTGLGLSISKCLVELMGGKIGVESLLGEGTTFWFHLPIHEIAEGSSWNKRAVSRVEEEQAECSKRYKEHLILGYRASNGLRAIMEHYLTVWGLEPTFYSDIDQITEVIDQHVNEKMILFVAVDRSNYDGLVELYEWMAQNRSKVRVVVIPSADIDSFCKKLIKADQWFLLEVPITRGGVRSLIHQMEGVRFEQKRKPVESHNLEALRVLVVEDNPVNLAVITGYLKRLSIRPEVAYNGAEAVEIYEKNLSTNPFDLVLMDCEMPVMDGVDASRAIKLLEEKANASAAYSKQCYVVGLSAHALREVIDRALSYGRMDAFLTKPIKYPQLITQLGQLGYLQDGEPDLKVGQQ